MATSSFANLVQTKSIERVLSPIAAQVSNLIILNEASVQDQHAFPDLVSSAEHIFKTVRTLSQTGFKLAQESSDERLRSDMPTACNQCLEAGNNLLLAAQQLRVEPHNISMRSVLVMSAKKVLEYTVNVLLTSDDAEVRKIIRTTNNVMESLWILQNVQSWEDFRRNYQGFNDSIQRLLVLCDKRTKELVSSAKQEVISSSTMILRKALPILRSSTQTFLQNMDDHQSKVNRDFVFGKILMACSDIMKTVEIKTNHQNPGPSASTPQMLPSGEDLDYYLDAIVRNSLAVADKCEHQKRKLKIAKACQEIIHQANVGEYSTNMAILHVCLIPRVHYHAIEARLPLSHRVKVLETRSKLNAAQEAIIANRSSERYRQEFDVQTDKLQQCLHHLDRRVTMEIIAGVCIAFADVDSPLQNLVTAATSQIVDGSLLNYNHTVRRLKQCQQIFLDHSVKLCEAASHASSVAAEPDRIHAIHSSIAQVERLGPQIVSTSTELRQAPQNTAILQRLKLVKQEWRAQITVLSDLSIGAVSSGDFLSTTETLAKECVTKCQEALVQADQETLTRELSTLVGISEKAIYVCKNELHGAADPLFKSRLTEVTLAVNLILPEVASLSTDVICNLQETQLHGKFFERAKSLTEKLGEMRSIVKRSPVHLKDNSFEENDCKSTFPSNFNLSNAQAGAAMSIPEAYNVRQSSPRSSQVLENKQGRGNQGRSSPRPQPIPTDSSNLPKQDRKALQSSKKSCELASYITETRQCLLYGLSLVEAEDIQILKKLSQLLRSQPSSLMSRLLDGVSQSDYALVERRCNELSRRAASLKDFVDEPALRKSKSKEVANLAINTSSEVYESTADVVQLAWNAVANTSDTKASTQLKSKCDEWSEKLDIVRAIVDKLINPWSVTGSYVIQAVTLKDHKLFAKKVTNLQQHVLRMRELASAAKAAADAEDAVDLSVEGEPPARNTDSLRRIELVMVKSAEMDEITKRFIATCQEYFKNHEKTVDLDALEFLRRDWACKVQSVIFAVDDITAGTSAPVDGLCAAAFLRDSQTVRDRGKLLNTYILTLKDMADGCSAGCRDGEKARRSQETVAIVDRLTQEFQHAVLVVQEKGQTEASSVEDNLLFMSAVEKMFLLHREWSVKVHLFTSLIDDMTADVSAHVDRLAGAALSVSRVDKSLKLEYLRDFEAQSNKLSSKVARVRNHACLTISKSEDVENAEMVRATCDFLDRLTPQVIAATRGLADNPDQPTVEHFQMLRRQWASKAHLLMAKLQHFKNVQYSSVEVVTKELLASYDNDNLSSHVLSISGHYHPKPDNIPSPLSSGSIPSRSTRTTAPPASLHHGRSDQASKRGAKQRVDDLESSIDVIGGLVDTMSDLAMRNGEPKSQNFSKPKSSSRLPIDSFSSPKTKGYDFVATAVHRSTHGGSLERIESSESLNEQDLPRRNKIWSPSLLRKTVSLDGLNRSWREESEEDTRSKKLSLSIARAAAQLRDEIDKWEDENNNFLVVAKNMGRQMLSMAKMAKKKRRFRDTAAMAELAKSIANDCQVIWKFAAIIAQHCTDGKSAEKIIHSAECIPELGTQLNIIASVKSATPNDRSADTILVQNAQNLMLAVINTLRVIEGAAIKGLTMASLDRPGHVAATAVVFEWKRKLRRQRSVETLAAGHGRLGLRTRDENMFDPSLVDILHI